MPKNMLYFIFGKPYVLRSMVVGVLAWSGLFFFTLPIALSLGIGGIMVYGLYASMEFDQKKKKIKTIYEQQFLFVFRYFQILLQQSLTAYQALKTLLPYVEDPFHHQLALFLLQIDQDKSIQPYRDLAKTMDSMIVEQILLSMYQLDLQGGEGMSLFHFHFLFDQIEQHAYEANVRTFQDQLKQASGLVMIGTGLLTFLFLIGVVDIMVGLLYGA